MSPPTQANSTTQRQSAMEGSIDGTNPQEIERLTFRSFHTQSKDPRCIFCFANKESTSAHRVNRRHRCGSFFRGNVALIGGCWVKKGQKDAEGPVATVLAAITTSRSLVPTRSTVASLRRALFTYCAYPLHETQL